MPSLNFMAHSIECLVSFAAGVAVMVFLPKLKAWIHDHTV